MTRVHAPAFALLLLLAQASLAAVVRPPRAAIAVLTPTLGSAVSGVALFEDILTASVPPAPAVRVSISLQGLAPNSTHGIHVHVWGDVSDLVAANNTGGHFNPSHVNHTCDASGHYGDLGNISSDMNGHASLVIISSLLSFDNAAMGYLVARSVVVHADRDDCVSMPSGKSGKRIAQGVIGWHSADASVSISSSMPDSANMTVARREAKSHSKHRSTKVDNNAVSVVAAVSNSTNDDDMVDAIAVLTSLSTGVPLGSIYLHGNSTTVMVAFNLTSLPPSTVFGMRVLTFADIQTLTPPSQETPFAPVSMCPDSSKDGAVPDVFSFASDASGNAIALPMTPAVMSVSNFSVIPTAATSILGRLVALHVGYADCSSSSNSVGTFLAQGVVGLRDPTLPPSFNPLPPTTTTTAMSMPAAVTSAATMSTSTGTDAANVGGAMVPSGAGSLIPCGGFVGLVAAVFIGSLVF